MKRTELKELYQMMFPDYPDIVTTAQLQKMLGISRRLVYQLIGDGSIPGILIGKTYKTRRRASSTTLWRKEVKNMQIEKLKAVDADTLLSTPIRKTLCSSWTG